MNKLFLGHNISFKHAFEGLLYAFLSQPNFRIHSYFGVLAVFLGVYFGISYLEWLVLTLVIFLVFIVELINTSIEAATDLLTSTNNPIAKAAKDTASAAVLGSVIASLVIGYLIFGTRVLKLFYS